MIRLGIVVPCFNERDALPASGPRLVSLIERMTASGKIAPDSFVCFVDDGSTDATWTLIQQFAAAGNPVMGLKLSRNFGHQAALMAGLLNVPGDAVVSIDADLQDDVDAIERMVDAHAAGAHIVYGVRANRDSDSFLKRFSAQVFYRALARLGVQTVYNHADFRLMSRRAIESLRQFGEVNLYVRGVIPRIGLPHAIVEYVRAPRVAGESKYPLSRMLSLAWDGVTSFSVVPLRWVTVTGFLVFFVTLLVSGWILWVRLFTNDAIPGWASTVIPLFLLGGLQILSIGIVGEYLGKTYVETKARPRFFIEEIVEPHRSQAAETARCARASSEQPDGSDHEAEPVRSPRHRAEKR